MKKMTQRKRPRLDLKETEKEYEVSVELPGVEEKDVTIEVEHGALTISGEKKSELSTKDEKKGFSRIERSYGSFRRVLALPEDAEFDNAAATFKDGVLKLVIPRKEHTNKRTIAITKE